MGVQPIVVVAIDLVPVTRELPEVVTAFPGPAVASPSMSAPPESFTLPFEATWP
jgi:hypothetical protein